MGVRSVVPGAVLPATGDRRERYAPARSRTTAVTALCSATYVTADPATGDRREHDAPARSKVTS
jgi:hypothetical protein